MSQKKKWEVGTAKNRSLTHLAFAPSYNNLPYTTAGVTRPSYTNLPYTTAGIKYKPFFFIHVLEV